MDRKTESSCQVLSSFYITLTHELQTMLQELKQNGHDPEELVFKGPKGAPINGHNFTKRGWKKILTKLDIDYRRPYYTRHTLISHALEAKGLPALPPALF